MDFPLNELDDINKNEKDRPLKEEQNHVIIIENISKDYSGQKILDSINMKIPRGKLIAITGISGCGKSTLLKIMAGLTYPDNGKVYIDGINIFQITRSRLFEMRKDFGFVFQDAALISNLSIFENIALPLRYHYNLNEDEIQKRVNNSLEDFDLLHIKNYLPAQLSMGQRKLVSFARALIMKPRILFFDEPVSGIDAIARQKMIEMILPLKDDPDITILMVSHNLDFIKQSADYIALLHQGSLFAFGTRNEILKSKDPIINKILSIIVDEEALIAEEVLGILTGE